MTCICAHGWTGVHCELRVDYCKNVTCFNRGVCKPIFLDYHCQCLTDNYHGRHCETTYSRVIHYRRISTSFGYISILALATVFIFVLVLDLLEYVFAIGLVKDELATIKRQRSVEKQRAHHRPIVQRYVYVNPSFESVRSMPVTSSI
jgi:hypothetical protein